MADVTDVARDLEELVRSLLPRFKAISEEASLSTRGPDTWSRKQILGHLIDSALNNIHRFIRAQKSGELSFPDYDQPYWVDRNGYAVRPWISIVSLWGELNLHLAVVVARIPRESLETQCIIGNSKPLTLEFIIRDYVIHMRHHVRQILDPQESAGIVHPPFA